MEPSRQCHKAYINEAGFIDLIGNSDVTTAATDTTGIVAAAGALAIATAGGTGNGTAVAIAGSFGTNRLSLATEAFVSRINLGAEDDVGVSAIRSGDLIAISVGLAGSVVTSAGGSEGSGIGGSISVNTIDTATEAYLDHARLTGVNDVKLSANDDSNLVAGGGGVGFAIGGQVGIGAAVGVNMVTTRTRSRMLSSNVNADGNVVLDTSSDPDVVAVGLSAGAGQFGFAGTIGINKVDFATASVVDGSTVRAGGDVTVHATDTSRIHSDAGGVALGIKTAEAGKNENVVAGAFGVALAINDIGSGAGAGVTSTINNSIVTTPGDVSVVSLSQPRIDAYTIAGAVAVAANAGTQNAGALAGAAAASHNSILTNVLASIQQSTVNSGAVEVLATDNASIKADAGGFGIAVAVSLGGGAGGLGIGAGIALNDIGGSTRGHQHSNVTATGNVTVRATIAPPVGADSIDALAIAGAASVGVSTNGLAGAAAGAAAVTVNNIDRSVQAVIQSSGHHATGLRRQCLRDRQRRVKDRRRRGGRGDRGGRVARQWRWGLVHRRCRRPEQHWRRCRSGAGVRRSDRLDDQLG